MATRNIVTLFLLKLCFKRVVPLPFAGSRFKSWAAHHSFFRAYAKRYAKSIPSSVAETVAAERQTSIPVQFHREFGDRQAAIEVGWMAGLRHKVRHKFPQLSG